MTPDTISQTVLFPDLFDKPLVATFDEQHASSDGGGILLKAAERVYGLVKAFAGCLTDKRAPEKIGSPQTGVGRLRRDRRVGEGCWQRGWPRN